MQAVRARGLEAKSAYARMGNSFLFGYDARTLHFTFTSPWYKAMRKRRKAFYGHYPHDCAHRYRAEHSRVHP